MARERLQLGNNELLPGQIFSAQLKTLIPPTDDGEFYISSPIEAIREGGFYGATLLFPDFVIKTTEPLGAGHKIGRFVNHGNKPFPSQNLESGAQLDHLAAHLIHLAFPLLTQGTVITPESYGYIDMKQLGFAQVLERMHGRGARFDRPGENEKFGSTRSHIWSLGRALGIEQAAQVHPDNPFGKPNLWTTDEGQMIWLDVFPAMRHTGWVWPYVWPLTNIFYFPFHYDIRNSLGNGNITFNELHTNKFREHLIASNIHGSKRDEFEYYLGLYDDIFPKYKQEVAQPARDLLIADALKRGKIDDTQAKILETDEKAYGWFLTKIFIEPIQQSFIDLVKENPLYKTISDKKFRDTLISVLRDPEFRQQTLTEGTILRGLKEAYGMGLVTDQEWTDARHTIENPPLSSHDAAKLYYTYIGLHTYYWLSSQVINVVEASQYAAAFFDENPLAKIAIGVFIGWVLPSFVRALPTALVGKLTDQDLSVMRNASFIPKAGTYIAASADMGHRFGNRSEEIWHYTKRSMVAYLSHVLRPWGGWNTDHEEMLWKQLRADKW